MSGDLSRLEGAMVLCQAFKDGMQPPVACLGAVELKCSSPALHWHWNDLAMCWANLGNVNTAKDYNFFVASGWWNVPLIAVVDPNQEDFGFWISDSIAEHVNVRVK